MFQKKTVIFEFCDRITSFSLYTIFLNFFLKISEKFWIKWWFFFWVIKISIITKINKNNCFFLHENNVCLHPLKFIYVFQQKKLWYKCFSLQKTMFCHQSLNQLWIFLIFNLKSATLWWLKTRELISPRENSSPLCSRGVSAASKISRII